MASMRCHIQNVEFDFPIPENIKSEATYRAITATKFIQISTILTEHFIRFKGFERSIDATPALVVDVPNHMTCFDILDVMREIRDATGLWFDLFDPGMPRGFSKLQEAAIKNERNLRYVKSGQQPSAS